MKEQMEKLVAEKKFIYGITKNHQQFWWEGPDGVMTWTDINVDGELLWNTTFMDFLDVFYYEDLVFVREATEKEFDLVTKLVWEMDFPGETD